MDRRLVVSTSLLALLSLSACGGGGGSGGSGALTVPVTTPATPAVNYNTAEYRASYGLGSIKAIAAYDAGLSGRGITVAVLDSGVDLGHADLNANISSASIGITDQTYASAADSDVTDGHGTTVAGVIAAERNGTGMHGVAFNAQLLAINVADPGSCATDCAFYQTDIARGIDYARTHGAKVVNLSMGGDAVGGTLAAAMQRAVNAGMVIVISSGNDSAALPDPFARIAASGWSNGQIIIAGAVDQNGNPASFSNKPGTAYANYFIEAPGVSIYTTARGGGYGYASGTSYAAPFVSGAMALLFEKFPNLTARDVVDILLTTAADQGASGADAIYGWGLLDLAAALKPIGSTSIPTSGGSVASATGGASLSASALRLSPAFGDALTGAAALRSVMLLDGYRRSFTIDVSDHVTPGRTGLGLDLAGLSDAALHDRADSIPLGQTTRLDYRYRNDPAQAAIAAAYLDAPGAPDAPRGRWRLEMTRMIDSRTAVTMTRAEGLTQAATRAQTLFLGQSDALPGEGGAESQTRAAVRHRLTDSLTIAMSAARASLDNPLDGPAARRASRVSQIEGGLTLAEGATALTLTAGRMQESDSVLGAFSDGALRLGDGARTRYLRLDARLQLGRSALGGPVALYGRGLMARTTVPAAANSLITPDGAIASAAFEAGILASDLLAAGDQFGLRVAQPTRVTGGMVSITEITGRDYASDSLTAAQSRATLAPSGQETDYEIAYGRNFTNGLAVTAHALLATNPGHRADAAPAAAVYFSLASRF